MASARPTTTSRNRRRSTPMTAIRSPSARPGPTSTSFICIRRWWAQTWGSSNATQKAKRLKSANTQEATAADGGWWTAERDTMADDAVAEQERMRTFQAAALPHLDDVYTLARYLMRNAHDAEDAVQECYLRALRHFDSYRGAAMKPWLLAILRNVCNAECARRSKEEVPTDYSQDESLAEEMPMWQEPQTSPEKMIVRQQDTATIRRLVAELPEPFREAIVLREMNNLSYQEIAQVAGVPVGTVMSLLARARAMLRAAWNAAETVTTRPGPAVASGSAL